jgi:sulfur-carrier protein
MAVRLLFLGRLQDLAGAPERILDARSGETIAALIDRLGPGLAEALRSPRVRVALNGAVLGDIAGARAAEGDEIAFLPPVSGG